MIRLGAFKGDGVISKLIKWRTGGEYSHIALYLDKQYWIEANSKYGVVKAIYKSDPNGIEVDIYRFGDVNEKAVRTFLTEQLGKGYDLRAVLDIGLCDMQDRHLSNKWMCSELAYAALEKGGLKIFNDTKPWQVDPNLITRSTAFEFLETVLVKPDPFVLS